MTVVTFILFFLLKIGIGSVSFLKPVDDAFNSFSAMDLFFQILHTNQQERLSEEIIIVDITDVGPRGDIAAVLNEIADCAPESIGIDCIFEGVHDDQTGNQLLLEAVNGMKDRGIFAKKLIADSSGVFVWAASSFFARGSGIKEGYTNLTSSNNGSPVREFSLFQELNGDQVLSFPLAVVNQYAGREMDFGSKDLLINYENIRFLVLQPDEILAHQEDIWGKIVLVGGLREERDMFPTPIKKKSGLEIHAYAISTLLHGELRYSPCWFNWLLAVLLCYFFIVNIEHSCRTVQKRSIFLMELDSTTGTLYTVWSIVLCFISYILFAKFNYCLDAAFIFVVLALAPLARKLVKASILSLSSRGVKSFPIKGSLYE